MASERRSSISSIRSAMSRTSMGSGRPSTPPSTAERRPPSPLTQQPIGVPTLAPPPAVGKGGLPPPMTPQRKAIQRQKSPLSAEAFSSPAPSMPGSFPEESPATNTAVDDESSPATTPNPKRMSMMSKFLPLKALRRSYDASSPQSSEPSSPALDPSRPRTPGENSVASSPKPSLRKRVSGSFWQRKSSLNMDFTPGTEGDLTDARKISDNPVSPSSPRTNGFNEHETIREDSRPTTPTLADNSPVAKKRKSGTFWRRTSSLTVTQTLNTDRSKTRHVSAGAPPTNGTFSPTEIKSVLQNGVGNGKPNGQATAGASATEGVPALSNTGTNLDRKISNGNHVERKTSNTSGRLGRKPSIPGSLVGRRISGKKPQPLLTPPRSASPPPQLPEFVGGGSGLGLEDWFL